MKKNKSSNYILLVVVLALWVVVFYRLYVSFFTEGKVVDLNKTKPLGNIKAEVNSGFTLLANYNDPFFGSRFSMPSSGQSNGSVKRVLKPKVEKVPEVPIDWSFLNYLGLIKNKNSQKQVALVTIHGKEYMVSEGDKINEVTFIKNFKDSIKVSYSGKVNFLRKQ